MITPQIDNIDGTPTTVTLDVRAPWVLGKGAEVGGAPTHASHRAASLNARHKGTHKGTHGAVENACSCPCSDTISVRLRIAPRRDATSQHHRRFCRPGGGRWGRRRPLRWWLTGPRGNETEAVGWRPSAGRQMVGTFTWLQTTEPVTGCMREVELRGGAGAKPVWAGAWAARCVGECVTARVGGRGGAADWATAGSTGGAGAAAAGSVGRCGCGGVEGTATLSSAGVGAGMAVVGHGSVVVGAVGGVMSRAGGGTA
jgi:hypothetical protein